MTAMPSASSRFLPSSRARPMARPSSQATKVMPTISGRNSGFHQP
jgi:hypothetical protein